MERSVWGFKITYSNTDATWITYSNTDATGIMHDERMVPLEDVMFCSRQEAENALLQCVVLEDRMYTKRLHNAEAKRCGNGADSFVLEATDGYLFVTMVDLYDKVLVNDDVCEDCGEQLRERFELRNGELRAEKTAEYVEIDGVRYERVRECELEYHDTGWVSCRECNTSWKNDRPHVYRRCPYCGAKVKR